MHECIQWLPSGSTACRCSQLHATTLQRWTNKQCFSTTLRMSLVAHHFHVQADSIADVHFPLGPCLPDHHAKPGTCMDVWPVCHRYKSQSNVNNGQSKMLICVTWPLLYWHWGRSFSATAGPTTIFTHWSISSLFHLLRRLYSMQQFCLDYKLSCMVEW